MARSNGLLPILAISVVLMALFVGLKSLTGKDSMLRGLLDQVPIAPDPDADTPAETIRTLTAKVADMTAEMHALREDHHGLQRQREQLRQDLMADWKAEQARQKKPDEGGLKQALLARLDELAKRVSALDLQAKPPALPVGVGLDPADEGKIAWIEPLDIRLDDHAGFGRSLLQPAALKTRGEADTGRPAAKHSTRAEAKPAPLPYVTVPANATLIGSTGWTALVGRIPVQGNVQDPYPFKLIVGADNLAANGITIPQVEGMIFSGIAVGDWNLSCVSGTVNSVTFVFTDGTLRTLTNKSTESKRLGWISDDIGIPCVSGKLITNAAAYLTNRIAIGAIEAAAYAGASAETTTRISPEFGTGSTTVTGDKGRYVLGKTLAGGAHEVREWLDARMGQSFDAVFVPAGAKVAIHIDETLRIDYDPLGRKVNHATNTVSPFTHPWLD